MDSKSQELRQAPKEIFKEGGCRQAEWPAPRGSICTVIWGASKISKPEERTSFPEEDTWWIEPGALREDTRLGPVRTSDVYSGDVREDLMNLVAINPLCCAALRKTDHPLNPERSGVLRSSIYARDIGKEIDPCREHAGEDNEDLYYHVDRVGSAEHVKEPEQIHPLRRDLRKPQPNRIVRV